MNISTVIISILIIALCLLAICVKILLKKNGEFPGTCASNSPFLNNDGEKCGYCGADPGERCSKDEKPSDK